MPSRIIFPIYTPCVPHHTKNVPPFPPACCSYNIWTALPLPSNLLFGRNLLHGGQNPAQQQKSTHFSNQKNPPHQTAIFNTSFIYNCSHCCCITFLASGFIYRYIMLILISSWLMNLKCCMIKALNGPNSFKQNPQSHSVPIAIWNNLLQ